MSRTLVVKIGTSSLTRPASGELALATIASLVETLVQLRRGGDRLVLVSSGAVGVGCGRLGLAERPRHLARKQAVAAVGQGRLMRIYDDLFSSLEQPIAQVLLTRRDLMQRASYVNAYNTFQELFALGVIPVVNENDTVAVEELQLKFGDNDTLSALVASLVEADWLFLLTDVDRLYSADPHLFPEAQPIARVSPADLDHLQIKAGASSSQWGTGGMATKLAAARIATRAGTQVAIAPGRDPTTVARILAGEPLGTLFEPRPRAETARKRWIAHSLVAAGQLTLDPGAVQAIQQGGKSLLAAGIAAVDGEFAAMAAVRLCDRQGREIARGLTNYSSHEIRQIQGAHSERIPDILGYAGAETVVHRDNLVLAAATDG